MCHAACVHVQAQDNDDENLEIVLTMAMEPDLLLRFTDFAQYCVWKRGLACVIGLLEQPNDVVGENSELVGNLFAEVHSVPHGMLRLLLLESSLPGALPQARVEVSPSTIFCACRHVCVMGVQVHTQLSICGNKPSAKSGAWAHRGGAFRTLSLSTFTQ